jgi:hypothetical protein
MIKVMVMGFSRKRIGREGKPRYTAYYLDIRGQERSAGTFSSRKASDNAWQDEEAKVRAGKPGNPARGRQTFEEAQFPSGRRKAREANAGGRKATGNRDRMLAPPPAAPA